MGDFRDKTVWITGASSGIGEALTYAFNKEGAIVLISSRKKEALEQVKLNCHKPENIHIFPLDLEKESELISIAGKALNNFPNIDILINNGGISQRSLVKETNMLVYRKLMEVNYFGTVALTLSLIHISEPTRPY